MEKVESEKRGRRKHVSGTNGVLVKEDLFGRKTQISALVEINEASI